jgi:hypothetical protein
MEHNSTNANIFKADTNIIMSTVFLFPIFAHIFDIHLITLDMGSFPECSF